MVSNRITVEVAYATRERQVIIALQVAPGSTIGAVIQYSGILQQFPEIDVNNCEVGVFSKRRSMQDTVKTNERIEIYRPLVIDPKQARRLKAKASPR